jgi:regulator of replication initiation timing
MSFTPIEDVQKSNQELEALMKDVQVLLHAFNNLKTENKALQLRVAEQDKIMETAHHKLIAMLKRLPTSLETIVESGATVSAPETI